MRHIGAQIALGQSIAPISSAASTVNGTGVNRDGYLSASLDVETGAASGTPTTTSVVVAIQHSNDNGSTDPWTQATDKDGNNLATAAQGASAETKYDFDLSGLKKYVRAVATISFTGGTTPQVVHSSVFILGGAYQLRAGVAPAQ